MEKNCEWDEINKITEDIIGAAYEVGNVLGSGFLEKVYENALAIELRQKGYDVSQQAPIKVYYKGEVAGDYVADLFVKGKVIVELKVVKEINNVHLAQCLNYLKATEMKICLLINFYKSKVQVKRIIND